eukprot:GHUV01042746.1.p2 GENE.GHUV01042746.1~~GHUV01042746.1.p2  ORF type:complete len:105 (+),score=11.02 GHUV01042746.1:264-578(+)
MGRYLTSLPMLRQVNAAAVLCCQQTLLLQRSLLASSDVLETYPRILHVLELEELLLDDCPNFSDRYQLLQPHGPVDEWDASAYLQRQQHVQEVCLETMKKPIRV